MIAGLTMLETALGHSLCIGLFKVLGSNVNTSFLLPESLTNCTQVKGDFAQINHRLVSGSLYVFILGKSCWLQLHLFHGSIKVMLFENHTFFSSILSAVWVFMTLLPTLMLNSEKRNVPLGTRDYIGWTIWGLGFATEAIADQQKWVFKRDPDNAVSEDNPKLY